MKDIIEMLITKKINVLEERIEYLENNCIVEPTKKEKCNEICRRIRKQLACDTEDSTWNAASRSATDITIGIVQEVLGCEDE